MTTPAKFAAKMTRVAAGIKTTDRRVAAAAALVVKQSVQAQLQVAAPKGRLNVGKNGTKIGVRFTVAESSARVFATGPFQLIERDTKAHRIPRATVGRGKVKRANTKPVFIPGVGVRASVAHPGTKGKHPWAKGVAAARPAIGPVAAKAYFAPIRNAF